MSFMFTAATTVSRKMVDPAFKGVGQTPGLDVWRIEVRCSGYLNRGDILLRLAVAILCYYYASCVLQKLTVVPVEKKLYGKFHTGDSYIVLEVCSTNWAALFADCNHTITIHTYLNFLAFSSPICMHILL